LAVPSIAVTVQSTGGKRILDIPPKNTATFSCTAGIAQRGFRGTYKYVIQWYKGARLHNNISETRGFEAHEEVSMEFMSPGKHLVTCVVSIGILPAPDYLGSSNFTAVYVQGKISKITHYS